MASAVVGTLRVMLDVNAAHFASEFNKAEVKVGSFDKLVSNTSRSLTRMVEQFSGQRIVAEAAKMAAAVEKVGGVSALTERELSRVASTVNEATAKLRAMGAEVPPSIQKLHQEIQTLGVRSDSSNISFGKLVGSFVTAQAIVGTVKSLFNSYVGFIGSSIQSFANAESAQVKLTAALRAQGNATPEIIKQQADLAAQFQRTTVYADDLLMEMQALLVQVGNVAPHQMASALKAATDLASGLGIDLRTATMLVGKAFEGETGTLKRYGIVIDEAKLKAEGVTAVLDAVQQRFGGQAQAEVSTYAGQIQQLGNAWDDLKEKIGALGATAPEVNALLFTINQLLQDMNRDGTGAETTVGKLWQAWEKYIEVGRTITPGLMAWNRLLNDQADAAERASRAAQIKEPVLPGSAGPAALPNISHVGMALFNKDLEEHKKRVADAIQAAAAFQKAQDVLFGRDLIARANDFSKQLGDVNNVAKLSADKKLELNRAVTLAIETYDRLGQKAPKALRDIEAATRPLLATTISLHDAIEKGLFGKIVTDLGPAPVLLATTIKEMDKFAASVASASLEGLQFDRVFGVLLSNIEKAPDAAVQVGNAFTDVFKNLPQLLTQAFTGGGGLTGAFKALGVQLADAIATPIFKKLAEVQTAAARMSTSIKAGVAGGLTAGLGAAIQGGSWKQQLGQVGLAAVGVMATTAAAASAAAASAAASGVAIAGASVGATVAAGALTLGIGAAVIGAALLIRHFTSVTEAVKEARKQVKSFEEAISNTLTAEQKAAAGGEKWRETVIGVRDAYLKLGRTAEEAEAAVDALWDTDNPRRSAAAILEIAAAFEAVEQATKEANSIFDEIMEAGKNGIPAAMRPAIDSLIALGLLTADQVAALGGLGEAGASDWAKVKAAADKYGVRLESLGHAFNAQRIQTDAAGIVNAFTDMTNAGADVGGVLFDMQDEISKVVADSKKFGTTIPANMKPWVEELHRVGMLVDANGDKITDLSDIKYGEEMKTEAQIAKEGWDKILLAIQALIDKINGPLENALDNATRDRRVRVDVDYNEGTPPPWFQDPANPHPYPERPGGGAQGMSAGGFASAFTMPDLSGLTANALTVRTAMPSLPMSVSGGTGDSSGSGNVAQMIVRLLDEFRTTLPITIRDAVKGVV